MNMPFSKYKGWLRLGIVLSFTWILCTISYAVITCSLVRSELTAAGSADAGAARPVGRYFFLRECSSSPLDGESCAIRYNRLAWTALGPTLLGWIFSLALALSIVWVRTGFRDGRGRGESENGDADLDEFIGQSLSNIVRGLDIANRSYMAAMKTNDALYFLEYTKEGRAESRIEFDVAIVTRAESRGTRNGSLKVSVVEASVDKSYGISKEAVSRMKFSVYVKNWAAFIGPRPENNGQTR